MDPSSTTYFGLRTEKKTFNPAYTRTSFLILKDGSSYAAYIMVITADSSYVNGDLTKLAHNTYKKHDADFSGLVMYFTPKGKFLSSYGYKNGQLLPPSGIAHIDTVITQLSKGSHLLKNLTSTGAKVLADQDPFNSNCVDYYVDAYVEGRYNGTYYDYTICYGSGGGAGTGGDAGSGNASSGGNSASTPVPCPNSVSMVVHPAGRVLANTAPIGTAPPPDGGFPDPTQTPTPPVCYIVQPTTPTFISDSDLADATPVVDSKPSIDPVKYKNCFNDGKTASSYIVTIYIDQPNPGHNDQYMINGAASSTAPGMTMLTPQNVSLDVGHAFVSFTKNNTDGTTITQVMGFYPSTSKPYGKGAIKDDTFHQYSVSYSSVVNSTDFNNALNDVISDSASSYYNVSDISGTEYNCTDAALSWMNTAGAILPNSVSRGIFANTPGDYGQALRTFPNSSSSAVNLTAPASHGPCN